MRRDLTGLRLEVSSIATLENLLIIPMNVGFGMSLALKKNVNLYLVHRINQIEAKARKFLSSFPYLRKTLLLAAAGKEVVICLRL